MNLGGPLKGNHKGWLTAFIPSFPAYRTSFLRPRDARARAPCLEAASAHGDAAAPGTGVARRQRAGGEGHAEALRAGESPDVSAVRVPCERKTDSCNLAPEHGVLNGKLLIQFVLSLPALLLGNQRTALAHDGRHNRSCNLHMSLASFAPRVENPLGHF